MSRGTSRFFEDFFCAFLKIRICVKAPHSLWLKVEHAGLLGPMGHAREPIRMPLKFSKVHMRALLSYGNMRMSYGNIRTISLVRRTGRCGTHARLVWGPKDPTDHLARKGTCTVPARLSTDPIRAHNQRKPVYERCVCSIIRHKLYATRTSPKYSHGIARDRTTCCAIIHGFSGFWSLRDPYTTREFRVTGA